MSGKVQVFQCPVDSFAPKQRPVFKGDLSQKKDTANGLLSKKEIRNFMVNVKDFSATTAQGMQKVHQRQDILTKLGVPTPKEQTMPFKMKMGILSGRKRRLEKVEQEAKESGTVASIPYLLKKQRDEMNIQKALKSKASPLSHDSLDSPDILRNTGGRGAMQHTQNMSKKRGREEANLDFAHSKKFKGSPKGKNKGKKKR